MIIILHYSETKPMKERAFASAPEPPGIASASPRRGNNRPPPQAGRRILLKPTSMEHEALSGKQRKGGPVWVRLGEFARRLNDAISAAKIIIENNNRSVHQSWL